MRRLEDLILFYSLLDRLEHLIGGARRLSDRTGRMAWPGRGVYFFREDGELRSDTGHGLRIVRVGIHALRAGSGTKLWTRLSQHKGQTSTGGGNHRGSIFRLVVGAALMRRDGLTFPTWGEGSSADQQVRASELALEQIVSSIIGAMSFLWVPVEDEPGPGDRRGNVGRNAIALLSNHRKSPLDPPSKTWLGHHSDRERVRTSGLWNQNHVEEIHDPGFLGVLGALVSQARHAA